MRRIEREREREREREKEDRKKDVQYRDVLCRRDEG